MAFVSNGGWIDGNSYDGFRLSLTDEYSRIYVHNLRGNQRTAGELSRREGGKVFGSGSRNTVAIFIGVRAPDHIGPCEVLYQDIGDYLTREEKLAIVNGGTLSSLEWQAIAPNEHGDWTSQRSGEFPAWPVIGDREGGDRVFANYTLGVSTARDSWVYGFAADAVRANTARMVERFNEQVHEILEHVPDIARMSASARKAATDRLVDADPSRISWSAGLRSQLLRLAPIEYRPNALRLGMYRPFEPQHLYFDPAVNERQSQLPSVFPTSQHQNIGIYVVGAGSEVPFSALALNLLPNLHVTGAGSGGQFFPRWTYEKAETEDGTLDLGGDAGDVDEYGYRRVDNITDGILASYRAAVGDQVTKDDIFFYVYGLLHDPAYRETYAADLKKMLPHIPTPENRERFEQLASAGKALSDLHVGYEEVEPYPVDVQLKSGADPADRETWRVTKLKWAKKKDPDTSKSVDDHTKLIYNTKVTITGIPEDAERYMLGSRSALAWIIDRYQVKTDKASGIVNDPNDWCDEHDDPRYIVDLIAKVTTVAVQTMKIVDGLAESA